MTTKIARMAVLALAVSGAALVFSVAAVAGPPPGPTSAELAKRCDEIEKGTLAEVEPLIEARAIELFVDSPAFVAASEAPLEEKAISKVLKLQKQEARYEKLLEARFLAAAKRLEEGHTPGGDQWKEAAARAYEAERGPKPPTGWAGARCTGPRAWNDDAFETHVKVEMSRLETIARARRLVRDLK